MRYLVISDIHANLEALTAVLEVGVQYDKTLVLGDLVGYGADPNAVVERVRGLAPAVFIRGNHDKVGAGLEDVDGFNYLARQAIGWTAAALTPENREWLAHLPAGPLIIDDLVEICHGAPFNEDVYVFDDIDALRALRSARRPLCLFGHTHVPAAFRLDGELRPIGPGRRTEFKHTLEDGTQYLVNCGAVGQPRDGDARAAYGVVDTESRTVEVRRVEYDVAVAQAKIIAAGLPEVLAQRLALGR